MKKFIYTGYTSCHTSINIKGKPVDFSFHKDGEYELPENDRFVKSLVAQNLLSPMPQTSPDKQHSQKKLSK